MSNPPPPPGAFGLTIPGVHLDRVIGRGGFATVYGGTQQSLERPVAVKVDSRELHDERNRRRYLREVQAAGRLAGHPHVVSLIDTGVLADARPFIVMERCDGGSLIDVAHDGPLPAADAVALVAAASSALGAAHRAGILHRDVKPGNILLDSYGSPRLTDFGIASIEREGRDPSVTLESLTPDFACPEAFALTPPRPEGDVWSMGAVLFYLLTGRGPRRAADGSARSLAQIMQALDRPVDLSSPLLPAAAREVLGTAMHTDPDARYPDAVALCDALTTLGEEVNDEPGGSRVTITGPGVALRLAQAVVASAPSLDSIGSLPPGTGLPTPGPGSVPGISAAPALGAVAVPARRRRPVLTAVAGAALVVGIIMGLGMGRLLWSDANATPAGSDGGPTTGATPLSSEQATEAGAAHTPPHPVGTCLGGIVSIAGQATAKVTDCNNPHYWEVYAVGTLDESTTGASESDLKADPQVQATCTREAAIAYGEPNPDIEVLGPTEVQWTVNGARGFSCLVSSAEGGELHESYAE